jgi:hypothetical protein
MKGVFLLVLCRCGILFFLHHCIGLKIVLGASVSTLTQSHESIEQVPADLPANGNGGAHASSRRVRLITRGKRA